MEINTNFTIDTTLDNIIKKLDKKIESDNPSIFIKSYDNTNSDFNNEFIFKNLYEQ